MSDRELLDLAAKAAGIDMTLPSVAESWNPLADDGDALRLAIALKLDIEFHWREGGVSSMNYEACAEFNMQGAGEKLGEDEGAATRRAITRAAAQIGKAMP